MLRYIMVGTNDVPRSGRFYAAILTPLGYDRKDSTDKVAFALPDILNRFNGLGAVYVTKPHDGREATVGSGSMTAFRVETQAMVRTLQAAGIEAGGSDEGATGFRDEYTGRFYVGYLRDPSGNKVALFCTNPSEGTRGY
jgi:catechol 2,3-dioxygenase-like lactoylglutathione lyase family enzyme